MNIYIKKYDCFAYLRYKDTYTIYVYCRKI